MDLSAKLEDARRNVQAIGQQLAQKQNEAAGIQTILVKWQGVCEWLESVLRDEEEAKPPGAPGDNGHTPALVPLPGGEEGE